MRQTLARQVAAPPAVEAPPVEPPLHPVAKPARFTLGPWQFAAGMFAIVGFFAVSWTPVPDSDYWWHLADGRYIVAVHRLPVPDPFSFTAAGQHWVAHEWLTELVMYGLQRALGDRGTLMLFGLCAAAAAALTFSTLRRTGTRFLPANVWALLVLVALFGSIGPRPEVTAFALMAADVWLLERWVSRRDGSIWLLPLLLCFWVNVHGSWPAGIALPALILLGDSVAAGLRWQGATRLNRPSRHRLGVTLLAAFAAVCVNANGIAGVLYPLTHFHNPLNEYIAGNQATALSNSYAWPFFLLAGSYLSMVVVRRPRLPAADLFVGAAFIVAALWSWRLVPFAALCLAPLIGRVLTRPNESGFSAPRLLAKLGAWHDHWERRQHPRSARRQWLNAGILLLLAAVVVSRRPYDIARAGGQPVEAVDSLGARGLPGPLFNEDTWGGYLIWRLWPQQRVFIDDRGVDLYTSGHVFQDYLDVMNRGPNAESVLEGHGIRSVLVHKDWPLVSSLLATGRWQSTYQDSIAIRLERRP